MFKTRRQLSDMYLSGETGSRYEVQGTQEQKSPTRMQK